jgi:hypothetical protein
MDIARFNNELFSDVPQSHVEPKLLNHCALDTPSLLLKGAVHMPETYSLISSTA